MEETLLEIKKQIEELREKIDHVNYQMQELRESIGRASFPAQVLPVSKPYVHPWWEYQRTGLIPDRNHLGGEVQASGTDTIIETGS